MKGRCFLWLKHKIKYHGSFEYRCSRCLKTKRQCGNLNKWRGSEAMDKYTIEITFTRDEVFAILEDYYGESEVEENGIETWTEEEIKIAILNR